ncbi:MAG: hypothetical protein LAT83_19620, partial [Kiritimatiellae bacterium]|nr:hypothetical protein [Kiritimatiellia bacterium]
MNNSRPEGVVAVSPGQATKEVCPAWDETSELKSHHCQERKENEAEAKGARRKQEAARNNR